ncbi:MAG TPA: Hsp33 family molecular chaperone [Xanthobacteraceae bacterium]|jgi:molecular chaperone Hsp33
MTETAIPSRMPASAPIDDAILPFEVASLDLRGRVVRLGPVLDRILGSHDYPAPVAKLLGEAIALTVLLGSSLKFEGRFILQTQTDGPVRMLVVDFTSDFVNPGRVRACARFDRPRVEAAIAARTVSAGELLGQGHLAMTIDQGADMNRYQGLVALTGGGLEDAAHEYFLRSEQIPTRVRLAVAEEFSAAKIEAEPDGKSESGPASSGAMSGPRHNWRAGGMLLQFLPKSAERMRVADLDPGDAPAGTAPHVVAEDDAWREGRALIDTVEDIELIDPDLSSERLLYRLFHEQGVRVFRSNAVEAKCSCSRDNVANMLKSFSQDDRDHMVENGVISVTCEFCSSNYVFEPSEVAGSEASPS